MDGAKMNTQERAERDAMDRLILHQWTPWRDVAELFPGTPIFLATARKAAFVSHLYRRCKNCGLEETRLLETPFAEMKTCEGGFYEPR